MEMSATAHMPLFEVFIRSKRGLDHKHVGSLHAEDHQQALEYARDFVASQEDDAGAFFDPMDDKPYRHATHYQLPDEVNNM
jgi:ring-1,2-phenylacetyl-CoA epoxidase subunit PaaB